jgi:hypothetical protein
LADPRYQIFISSTYLDLVHERDRLLRELAKHNYIASGMEYFPAMDIEQFEFIKTVIDDADFYVVIVAGQYGSLAPDGIGYSEKEFEYAVHKGIPVVALLHSDWKSLSPDKRENSPDRIDLLERFRLRLSTGRLVKHWKDESQLCLELLGSLVAMSKRFPRPGWVRGGSKSPEELEKRIGELEIKSNQLEKLVYGPMSELVRQRLGKKLEIPFASPSNVQRPADALETEWQVLLDYICPRAKQLLPRSQFDDLIRQFVVENTKIADAHVSDSEAKNIRAKLFDNGIVTTMENLRGDAFIVTDHFGHQVARTGIEIYEASVRQNNGFFEDLGDLLNKHLFKSKANKS